ncbi:kinetochore protein Nuf2 [Entomortierella parvispora]|uniref:Kinetochore protein Nuf2 n=1 Tax=Entomortierella parvispora TaxID=205924 RepID=A0A9P3HKG7_9FUNG|nr:kinetochore protein Nuf2 [Entomortierella parvispora]
MSGRPVSNIPRPNSSSGAGGGMNGPPGNGGVLNGPSSNVSSNIHSSSSASAGGGNSNFGHSVRATSSNAAKPNAGSSNVSSGRYLFPLLKPAQVVQCMADLKLNFTGDDLEKPTPQKIMEVCDTFMDVAQGYIKDVVYLEDIQEMTTSQNPEFVFEAVRFYVFLTQLSRMMRDIGISDFSSRDLTKPEADRARRMISALINFAKFKQEREGKFFEKLKETDNVIERCAKLEEEYDEIFAKLETFKQIRASEGPQIEEHKAKNQLLVEQLEILKAQESDMTKRRDAVSSERNALLAENKELNELIEKATDRLNKMQSMRIEVPENLEEELAQLPVTIEDLQAQSSQLRKQVQSRYAAVERIEAAPKEVQGVQGLMAETLDLQERLQEDTEELDRLRSAMEKRRLELDSVRQRKQQLKNSILAAEQKLMKLKTDQQAKREGLEQKMLEEDRVRGEAEGNLAVGKQLVEEQQKRQQEILAGAAKYARETDQQVEQLKHQFECYSTEILQALKLN